MTSQEKGKTIKGIIFDLDGTLLDTERLSDQAIYLAFGDDAVPRQKKEEFNGLLPWEIKSKIMGLPGSSWIPMVVDYLLEHWGVNVILDTTPPVLLLAEQSNNSDEEKKRFLYSQRRPGDPIDPSIVNEFWRRWETNLNALCSEVEECKGATKLVQELQRLGMPMAIATSSRFAAVQQKKKRHDEIFKCVSVIVTGDDSAVKKGKPAPDIFLEAARRLNLHPSNCLVFEDSTTGCQAAKNAGCFVIAVPDHRVADPKKIFGTVCDEIVTDLSSFDLERNGLKGPARSPERIAKTPSSDDN